MNETNYAYYRLKDDVYFRKYGDVGYITSTALFNDKVVNRIGAIFLSALDQHPNMLYLIVSKIALLLAEQGIEIDDETIESDAIEFFGNLIEDGFLATGVTIEQCEAFAKGFSYNDLEPSTAKTDFTPEKIRTDADSQFCLNEYFLNDPRLTNFQIELTSCCNERCIHCYIPHEFKDDIISNDLYYSVLNQLQDLGTWHITLSGGEPMMHPRFKEFLQAAKERGFYVTILSNLTLLDDEIISIMADGNKSSVQVSLYSMNPATHDQITQLPGSFEKTVDAIKKLIEHDVPVQISCPTMKANKSDFGKVLQWAHDHKIRATTDYSIMAEYNHDTSNLAHRLTPEECGEVISDILKEDMNYQNQILSPDFVMQAYRCSNDLDAALCGVGISTCCMVSNGNVYPCPGWQEYICGNLNEQSLDYIWNDSPKMNWLRSLRRRDMKTCIGCENQAFCSPCMVRNANESPTGDPFEVSPYFCEVAKVNKELVLDWRKKHLKE